MRLLVLIVSLFISLSVQAQEVWQLQPWPLNDQYFLGATPTGEPTWVHQDSIGGGVSSMFVSNDTLYYIYKGDTLNGGFVSGGTVKTITANGVPNLFTTTNIGNPINPGIIFAPITVSNPNRVFASPDGIGGLPTFRSLTVNDLPNRNTDIGTFTNATVTTDAKGAITAISNGVIPPTDTLLISNIVSDSISNKVNGSGLTNRLAYWSGTKTLSSSSGLTWDDGNSRLSTGRINLGTASGTGRINLPDGGTTSADGIHFGTEHSIYRNSSNVLIVNAGNILRLTTAGSQRLYIDSTQVISLTPFSITPSTLTGSAATSALSISQTWNTTGSPTAIFANITNTASGASANLMNLQVGGVSQFKVSKAGNVNILGEVTSTAYYGFSQQRLRLTDGGAGTFALIKGNGTGILVITNSAENDINRLNFGGSNSAFPALKRVTTGLVARLADDSANTTFTASNLISTSTVRLQGYTVATLPAGTIGDIAYVTDALAPSFLVTVTGGGAIVTTVFYNGTNWVAK